MRFFSKITFVCNVCFYLAVLGRVWVMSQPVLPGINAVKLNPWVSSVVALGWLAIFVNIVFLLFFLLQYPKKKMNGIARYIVFFNLISLPAQVFYYFFSKF